MKPEKVKLRKLFRKTFDMLRKQTDSKEIALAYVESEEDAPYYVICDK